jgi:RNase adapter protein RapZ
MSPINDDIKKDLSEQSSSPVRLIVISGLSGSGISTALQALEDQGYFCVDNLPPPLISKLLELASHQSMSSPLAIGLDARSIHDQESAESAIQAIKSIISHGYIFQLVFLEALEEVRVQRFSTSRRAHPLTRPGVSLIDAIQHERQLMFPIRDLAHHLLDTSEWNVHECKRRVRELGAMDDGAEKSLILQVMSFGFRHGVPREADIVWDVRFLPNPHFDPTLRSLSGLDEPVRAVVLEHQATKNLLNRLLPLLSECIPAYEREGKSYLTVAIGCTGGHHRSVAVTEAIAGHLRSTGWSPQIRHRDLEKPY